MENQTPKPCTPEPCTHTEPLSDVRVSDNTMSLTLQELPQLHYDERTEGTLVDLGISITDSGVVVSSVPLDGSLDMDMADIADNIGASPPDPLPNASSSDTCPPELALAAIECSISQAKKPSMKKLSLLVLMWLVTVRSRLGRRIKLKCVHRSHSLQIRGSWRCHLYRYIRNQQPQQKAVTL
ncbi:uncharacterized protein LOC117321445 [Pecten maximus]|uniref:uncharacterized protein LOC117321445 n=1 Tax=Pecten maximus TaxID=6579 RepID=UPI001458A9AB|nr:uncharacterized protein LOC117321445 [Pecten maximus]